MDAARLEEPLSFTDDFSTLNACEMQSQEEYPAARPFTGRIQSPPYGFRLGGEVRSFVGIGRFILGLHQHIVVIQLQGLKDYLNGIVAGCDFDRDPSFMLLPGNVLFL